MIQCAHDTQTATSVNQFGELAEEFPAASANTLFATLWGSPTLLTKSSLWIKILKYAEVLNHRMI